VHRLEGAGTFRTEDGRATYTEQLRVPFLSAGTYSIPSQGVDPQGPHTEDEIYVVIAGRASLWSPSAALPVGPGDVVFVPAGEEHRFEEITEALCVLVVFGPAEHSLERAAKSSQHRTAEEQS